VQPIIKQDILDVLAEAIKLIKDGDAAGLNELSNHVIHDASIFQDDDSVSVAILVYAMSKIMARCTQELEVCKCDVLIPGLQKAQELLARDKDDKYRAAIKGLFGQIQTMDKRIRLYIQEVIDKARIKKGSKMHEHGISIARTAELLNISQWELMDYIGKTTIPDVRIGIPVGERLKLARSLFR
jgi:hypothetical protein